MKPIPVATRVVLALVSVSLLLAGCSNIPAETQPQLLDMGGEQSAPASVSQPPKGATPLEIVRGFIENGADPSNRHAASRAYLADSATAAWNDSGTMTIISDTFNTLGGAADPHDPNSQTVIVHGQAMGTLGADNGFQPTTGSIDFVQPMRVSRQRDGQWRIDKPPDGVIMTQTSFAHEYEPVPVYFFDPYFGALVPDLRYVAVEPRDGLPARVVDVLLAGPSNALDGAVQSAIPSGVVTSTAPAETADGALVVNLARLPDQQYHTKQLIIAQIVRTLQGVTTNPVRIESEGSPLIAGHANWHVSELPSYNLPITPNGALPGLVATHGRLLTLDDGSPVAGPAGNGTYQVVTAAQSIDGSELALVCQNGPNEELRVGQYGRDAAVVSLPANQFTRPTWMPGDEAGDPSREVWTVADGQVIRLLSTQQGTWYAASVDASALQAYGQITDLRLSRDGTRVAAIVSGHLYVGSVINEPNSVSIKKVAALQPGIVSGAVGVDWLNQVTVVVATTQPILPVASVTVDGLTLGKYNTSNLTNPIAAITAADSRPVVVADPIGLWTSADSGEVWLPEEHNQGADSIPFYPG